MRSEAPSTGRQESGEQKSAVKNASVFDDREFSGMLRDMTFGLGGCSRIDAASNSQAAGKLLTSANDAMTLRVQEIVQRVAVLSV